MQPIKWFLFTFFKIGIKPIEVPIKAINKPWKLENIKISIKVKIKKKIFSFSSFIFSKCFINFFARRIAITVDMAAVIKEIIKEDVRFSLVNFSRILLRASMLPFLDLFIEYKETKDKSILNVVNEPVNNKDSSKVNFFIVEAKTAACDGPNAGKNVEKNETSKAMGIVVNIPFFVRFGCVIVWLLFSCLFLIEVSIDGIANNPESNGNKGSFKL